MTAGTLALRTRRPAPYSRLVIGVLGGSALLAGLWAALLLLGLHVPTPRTNFAEVHGPLMVLGFLGTLIALERAVAIGVALGYVAPLAAGLGAVALIAGLPLAVGQVLLTIGGVGLAGLYAVAARRQHSVHLLVLTGGALSWVVATVAWLCGRDVDLVVPWLAGYLVLTIAGERLELARVVRATGRARDAYVATVAVFVIGLVVSFPSVSTGVRIAGAGLLGLAAWLMRNDIARRTVRRRGLTRYMAVSLLGGYAWLAVAGALWLGFGTLTDGAAYDAMLHALFLGFVFSMVFAHAPVIVPAVFRVRVPYHSRFYAHVILLHASLLLRLVGGDVFDSHVAWQVGGVLNELALLGFVASTCAAVVHARRRGDAGIELSARPLVAAAAGRSAQP